LPPREPSTNLAQCPGTWPMLPRVSCGLPHRSLNRDCLIQPTMLPYPTCTSSSPKTSFRASRMPCDDVYSSVCTLPFRTAVGFPGDSSKHLTRSFLRENKLIVLRLNRVNRESLESPFPHCLRKDWKPPAKRSCPSPPFRWVLRGSRQAPALSFGAAQKPATSKFVPRVEHTVPTSQRLKGSRAGPGPYAFVDPRLSRTHLTTCTMRGFRRFLEPHEPPAEPPFVPDEHCNERQDGKDHAEL